MRINYFVCGCFAALSLMLLSPIAVASYVGAPLSVVFMPFDPGDEIALQAAVAEGDIRGCTIDERLKLLPGIEIRTALEDYQRLHYELG